MKFYIGEQEIEFDENTHQLKFNKTILSPAIRTYGDIKDMYIDKENIDDDKGLYFMFRGVYLNKYAEDKFKENKLRYDITVIIPEIIGDEFNKTYGHYHPLKNDGKRFEEIYEVLSGSAIYLQQSKKEVKFTEAFAGDKVVMDEGFGHITINTSDEEILVMTNIVDDTFSSEYGDYKKLKGGNYYYTTIGFKINDNYKNDLKLIESEELFEGGNMYNQFLDNPEKFNFLH